MYLDCLVWERSFKDFLGLGVGVSWFIVLLLVGEVLLLLGV